jgi:ATP-dependent DNA helicase RecG
VSLTLGIGIPKILKAMQHNGSPPPAFKTDQDRTFFLLRLLLHPRFTTPLNAQATGSPP